MKATDIGSVPRLEFVATASVKAGKPIELGEVPAGRGRIVPIVGGTVEGPRLSAVIEPGGADWQTIHADGLTEIMARYTLHTTDGVFISVINAGVRYGAPEVIRRLTDGEVVDPKLYSFLTRPVFEVGAGPYQWLTRGLFIGLGERQPDLILIRFFRVVPPHEISG